MKDQDPQDVYTTFNKIIQVLRQVFAHPITLIFYTTYKYSSAFFSHKKAEAGLLRSNPNSMQIVAQE